MPAYIDGPEPAPGKPRELRRLRDKLADNSQCANCLDARPDYICLDFNTWVCRSCSEVHRESGHRILSVASATDDSLTAEETLKLSKGGNRRAAKEFLAFWRDAEFRRPGKGEMDNLTAFIRKAYVIKCWQRQPRRESTASVAVAAGVAAVQPADAAAVAPAGVAPAAAAPPQAAAEAEDLPEPPTARAESEGLLGRPAGYVLLQKDAACFCARHVTSAGRRKVRARLLPCGGCGKEICTNYSEFAFCPGCSQKRRRCMICGAPAAPESPKPQPPRPPLPRRPVAPEPGPLTDLLGLEWPASPKGGLDLVAELPEPPPGDASGAELRDGGAAAPGAGDCGGPGGSGSGASTPPTSADCDWEADFGSDSGASARVCPASGQADFGSDSCASAWACPAAGQVRSAGCGFDPAAAPGDLLGTYEEGTWGGRAPPAPLVPAALEAMDSKQLMAVQQMIAQTLRQRAGLPSGGPGTSTREAL